MGIIMLQTKNITLLVLLLSTTLLSTSFAGRRSKLDNKLADQDVEDNRATYKEELLGDGEVTTTKCSIHERVLRANTQDYGNYNPAPALVKPPFKLIPN